MCVSCSLCPSVASCCLIFLCFLLVFTVTFKLFLLQKVPSIANEQDTSMKSHENPNENLNEIHFGNAKT